MRLFKVIKDKLNIGKNKTTSLEDTANDELKLTIARAEKLLFDFLLECETKSETKEGVKKFCTMLVEYCRLIKYSDCSLPTPEINFHNFEDDTSGRYHNDTNSITISDSYIDKILRGEQKFIDLVNTIGHEMEHYKQNSSTQDYDKLTKEEQQKVDERLRKSIDASKRYLEIKEKDIKTIHDLLSPYLDNAEIPKGYKTCEDFYKDIMEALYYAKLSEKEAREAGVDFSAYFYRKFFKSIDKSKLPIKTILENEVAIYLQKAVDAILYSVENSKADKFSKTYFADEKTILEIVKNYEANKDKLEDDKLSGYEVALMFLTKDKTLEQKMSLLKNAIFNGYSLLSNILVFYIQKDMDFKKNKDSISSFVRDCLTGKAYSNEDKKIYLNIGFEFYNKILSQEDFEILIEEVLKENNKNAEYLIYDSEVNNFTLKSVLKYQDILMGNDEADMLDFFEALFSQITIENKIELLKSNKLHYKVTDLLIKYIKGDEHFEEFKQDIEPLIESIEEKSRVIK